MSSASVRAFEAMRADAGGMMDILDLIVHEFDNGRIKDCVVKHNGEQVWLIDELAREMLERHQETA